jgi:hypothetical protein
MRTERLRQSLALAALAVSGCFVGCLVGCGDDGGGAGQGQVHRVPGCEAIDHTPCDVRAASCQDRLFALAGCLRGEAPGSLPLITVVSEADFAAILTTEAAMSPPQPHRGTWDWALSSLRLIQPGSLAMDSMIAQSAKLVLGVYRSDTSKDIVIVDHGADFDAASASPVLVHEMVHALQDREVDLTRFETTFASSGDSSLAVRSMIEGEARMHETRYHASVLGLDPADVDWTRRFENSVAIDQKYLLMEPSPLTATSRAFPYEWGARYVYNRWALGGMAGVHGLLLAPPVTTRVLMASVAADVDPEPAPALPALPSPPVGWTSVDNDVLGAWGLFLAMTEAAPGAVTSDLETLALSWRADGVGIYEGPGATAVVWRIDVGSATVAAQVASLLQSLPGVTVRTNETWVTLARASDAEPLDWAFAMNAQ